MAGRPCRRRGAARGWRGVALERQVGEPMARVVAVLRRTDLDVDQHRDEVQLLAVLDLQLAGGPADRGERALGDLDGLRIGVDEVEAIPELAALVLALEDVDLEPEILPRPVPGGPHLAGRDLADIAAGRQQLEARGGLDGGGIEGGAKIGHGRGPLLSGHLLKCGMAAAKASQDSGRLSGRPYLFFARKAGRSAV